ncbi:MAG: hypothetical protein IJ055_03225 [Oscillospiraceae bacterium]|nr:hypothetical protein [Oscillospiraceae bacterium]
MKKSLAGVLAVLCVAACAPVNVGTGGFFGGTSITAGASDHYDVNMAYFEKNGITAAGRGDEPAYLQSG